MALFPVIGPSRALSPATVAHGQVRWSLRGEVASALNITTLRTDTTHYSTVQYITDVMLLGVAGVLQLLTFALVQIIGKFKTRIQGEKKMISPFHCIEAPSCHDIYP